MEVTREMTATTGMTSTMERTATTERAATTEMPSTTEMTATLKAYIDERFDRLERMTLMNAKEVLNVEEAAMLIGYKVSGLYTLTSEKRVPHYKRNGKLYFKRSELEEWMTEKKVKTEAEINIQATTYCATGRY